MKKITLSILIILTVSCTKDRIVPNLLTTNAEKDEIKDVIVADAPPHLLNNPSSLKLNSLKVKFREEKEKVEIKDVIVAD